MNIEIKGVQFVNKGAELMLHAVLQQLGELAPQADVVLRPKKHAPYHKRAALGAYQKLTLTKSVVDLNIISYWLPKRFRLWLKRSWGIVTEADVDITLDASGFAYGDQWTSVALRQLAYEINRYHKKNKTYIFLPQALGPFTRPNDRKRLAQSLPNAALILAREESSFENVRSLGVDESVLKQYPDFTNLVCGECPSYIDHASRIFLVVPNSKMLSPKNPDPAWCTEYISTLVAAISYAQQHQLVPVVLNHEGDADQSLCDTLVASFSKPIKMIREDNPLYVKGIIGHSELVLCSRFHGCVSALSQGVPCLGTSWSYKYERLFDDYARPEFLIKSPIQNRTLHRLMKSALNGQYADNKKQIVDLKVRSVEMWQQVRMRLAN